MPWHYMRKNDVYKVLDGYVAWMLKDKFAPNSLRNRLSAVKKFLAINDFELDNAKMRVKVDLPGITPSPQTGCRHRKSSGASSCTRIRAERPLSRCLRRAG